MIRAIVWKELREQGLIALTLVIFGGALLVAAAALADPPSITAPPTDVIRYLGIGRLATLMLAVTAGMVCGGAVFAAEREAATFAYLDSLPASRWKIWRAKLIAGAALAILQIGLLIALAAALGLVSSIGWGVAVSLYAMLAFVWGVFGSTTARTTLGSVGIAIPAASLTAFIVMVPVTLFFQTPGIHVPRLGGAVLFIVCMFVAPLAFSAWMFTDLDRLRRAEEPVRLPVRAFPRAADHGVQHPGAPGVGARAPGRSRFGLSALLWLCGRQLFLPGLVLSGFALLFGLTLILSPTQPFVVWPALALMAGVVAGVLAFADEQSRGAARFWSEQRLPIGRVWAIKIGTHFLFCVCLLVLLALPLIIRTQFGDVARRNRSHTALAVVFRSPIFDELGPQGWKYLIVPAVYGFAAGHLCGLLFRKQVVACGVAAIVGGVSAMLWGPSLLAGGVQYWQLGLPPLALLLTGFFLLRAWVAERMPTRTAITLATSGSLATLLLLVAGIGYRVLEIPDRPDGEDDVAFVAGLPPIEKYLGGREFKVAAERYSRLAAVHNPSFDRPVSPMGPRRESIEERAENILRTGWQVNDPQQAGWQAQLSDWLDKMFRDAPAGLSELTWHETAANAAKAPLGIYEYPQFLGVSGSSVVSLDSARRMGIALLARGLQRQAEGDPDDFPRRLRVALTLAQTLRNHSTVANYLTGVEVERAALQALDQWLEQLPAASQRIRPVIETVAMTEPPAPFDPTPYFLAERHVLREGMKTPAQWLPYLISAPDANPESTATEVDLVGLAWAVPWERERTRRIVGLGFESGQPANHSVVLGRPGVGFLIGRARSPRDLIDREHLISAHRRAALVKVALRAFRAEEGVYPDSLTELEQGHYLAHLPTDPYGDGRTFGYRLSQTPGEVLSNPPRLMLDRTVDNHPNPPPSSTEIRVPVGQAILWSIGPDHIDQDGHSLPVALALGQARPPDLVYLVPMGRQKEP